MFTPSFEWWMAWRYLRARRASKLMSVFSLVSLLGVAVAVAALIVVLSVMNGFDHDLKKKILGMRAHLMVASSTSETLPQDESVENALKGYPEIQGVSPMVTGQGLVLGKQGAQGIAIIGVNLGLHQTVTGLEQYVTAGTLDEFDQGADVLVVGSELAMVMGVKPGDHVTVFVPVVTPSVLGLFSKAVKCRVVAIFKSGMYEYDRNLTYLPLPMAQKMFQMAGRVSQYAVRVKDAEQSMAVVHRIREDHQNLWASDWSEQNRNLFGALKMERYVMGLILVLILLVSSFTIIGTQTMLVMEKKREIGMIRAMGASAVSVKQIFLWQGSFIGVVGTLVGSMLGLGICYVVANTGLVELPGDIYYLSRLPIAVDGWDVAAINVMAVLVSACATWIPAKRAAGLDPVEAIRYG